ncbi:hypothetical protein COJ18_27005 [Bacillus cereus]|uniref:hypothetical protein n=1 Tax=Bacillus cereus TaxID=1396 RepID=UPI000BF297F0|nr:hypothetical protein [Bacillus cereus]PFK30738.1 hypothetical protein COJ18_27005 [Bacillus cereus]
MNVLVDEKIDLIALNDFVQELNRLLEENDLAKVIGKLGMLRTEKVSIDSFNSEDLDKVPGFYIFYIHFKNNQSITKLQKQWDKYKKKEKNNGIMISAINGRNVEFQLGNKKEQKVSEYVLYLGKSESSLRERLKQHIEMCRKDAYALKLYGLPDIKDYDITYESYYFKKEIGLDDATIQALLYLIEKVLHKTMKPLIGTSK